MPGRQRLREARGGNGDRKPVSAAPSTLHVAAVQWRMRPYASFAAFADQARRLLDASAGARVVVFPEYFTLALLPAHPDWRAGSENYAALADFTDEYRALFAGEATQRGVNIAAGTHLVRGEDGTLANVAHLFTSGGTVYRHAKTHTFWEENRWGVADGQSFDVLELDGVGLAMMICYESEMPEVATIQTRLGAEVLLCPAYTFSDAGVWRVRHCCQARCVENQVYVVNAFLVGATPPGMAIHPAHGRSAVLTPCDAGFPDRGIAVEAPPDEETVIECRLDLEALRENRRSGAATTLVARDRHRGLYARYDAGGT